MPSEDDEHPCAGQSCPALSASSQSLSSAGCDNVRVFQVPPEKRAVIEQILGGSKHFTSWKKAGVKLAGLFILAACVNGELSPAPHTGESIHAHGGHENKRTVVRRPGERRSVPDGPLEGNTGCKNRVDLCEHRIEDGYCLMQERRCRWIDRDDEYVPRGPPGIGNQLNSEFLEIIDRKISAVQKDVGELRRAKVESTDANPPNENEAARVFALMKSLDAGERVRKAPLHRVFRLIALDGLSQNAVARKCHCSTSLVSMRAKEIERRLGLPVTVLRTLASRVSELASVEDSRARRIYRRGLRDDTGEESEDG